MEKDFGIPELDLQANEENGMLEDNSDTEVDWEELLKYVDEQYNLAVHMIIQR